MGPPTTVEGQSERIGNGKRAGELADATAAAREHNVGVVRMGCVPVAWRKQGASKVFVAGSWDGWTRQLALEPIQQGGFGVLLCLQPGEYECKFIVDGFWVASEDFPVRGQDNNNVVTASDTLLLPGTLPPATFALAAPETGVVSRSA